MNLLKKTVQKLTTHVLEVPPDVVHDLPRITLIGNMQVYIENHRGVLHFSSDLLKLAISKGQLEIHGEGLVIRAIFAEEVFIEGKINGIQYSDKR